MASAVQTKSAIAVLSLLLAGCSRAPDPELASQHEATSVHDICTAIACSPGDGGTPSLPPLGYCQNYACGGSWLGGVHFYTCCHPDPESPCNVYQGASDGEYCNSVEGGPGYGYGTPTGGGCNMGAAWPMPTSPDGSCNIDKTKRCDDFCSKASIQIPGFCWSYTVCFNICMKSNGKTDAITCNNDATDPNNACNGSCEY
jgi:hypothetical protein